MLQEKLNLQQEEVSVDWHLYESVQFSRTSTGLPACISSALTYLFGFVTGALFLLVERENRFVRFHALQSIYVSVSLIALYALLNSIPVIGWFFGIVIASVGVVLWIILMLNAYSGKWSRIFIAGTIAERQLQSGNTGKK